MKILSTKMMPYAFATIMWLILAYPSIIDADWFYLDAPINVTIGDSLFTGFSWLLPTETGRYVPFYWFYYGITSLFLGKGITYHFFIQSLVVLFSTFLIVYLLQLIIDKRKAVSYIAILLFYTSSPMSENIYTIGKPEHLVLFFSLIIVVSYVKYTRATNLYKKIILIFISVLSTLLMIWSKETGIVIIVFSLSVVGLTILKVIRNSSEIIVSKSDLAFHIILLISVFLAKLPVYLFSKSTEPSYTSYPITIGLVIDNLLYYIKNQPDVLILGFVSLIAVVIHYLKIRNKENSSLIVFIGVLCLSWAYFLGLLVWRWPFGYYLYVISAFFCITVSLSIGYCLNKIKYPKMLIIMIAILIISRFYSVPYNAYIATSQSSISKLYTEVVQSYLNMAKDRERLLFENWAFFEEPVTQTNILLKDIFGRKDLEANGLADIFNPELVTEEVKKLYAFTDSPEYKTRLPRKGDFIVDIIGNKPAYWNLRGVAPYVSNESRLLEEGFKLKLITEKITSDRQLYITSSKKIVFGETFLGYRLYKVEEENSHFLLWEGRYPDRWIGEKSNLTIEGEEGSLLLNIKINSLDINSPNKIKVVENNNVLKEILVNEQGEISFDLPIEIDNAVQHKLEFLVENTFVPKELNMNTDSRKLGVQVDVAIRSNTSN